MEEYRTTQSSTKYLWTLYERASVRATLPKEPELRQGISPSLEHPCILDEKGFF